jgi:hypothetical protein
MADFSDLNDQQKKYLEKEAKKPTDKRRKDTAKIVAEYIKFKNEDTPGRVSGAALLPFLQGLSLGTADEIGAGVSTGFGLFGDYGKRLEQIRGAEEKFRQAYPGQALASELAGGVAGFGKIGSLIKGSKKIPQILRGGGGTTVAGKIGRSTVPGAIGGGIYGFTTGEGAADRRQDAILGAGTGAIINPAFTGLAMGGSAVGRGIKDTFSKDQKPVNDAIQRAVDVAGGYGTVKDTVARGKPLGAIQGVTDDIRPVIQDDAVETNRLRDELIRRRDESASNTLNKIIADIDDTNISTKKSDENIVQYAERISKNKLDEAKLNYDRAKLNEKLPVEVRAELDDILTDTRFGLLDNIRSIKAIRQANNNRKDIYKVNEDGSLVADENLSVQSLEDLYIALRDATDKQDIKIIRGGDDPLLTKVKNLLDDKYEDLAKARVAYKKRIDMDDAYKNAKSLFTKGKYQEFVGMYDDAIASGDTEIIDSMKRAALKNIYDKAKNEQTLRSYLKELDSNSFERKLLEKIYPTQKFDEIVRDITDATDYMYAESALVGGSRSSKDLQKANIPLNRNQIISNVEGVVQKTFGDVKLTPEQRRKIVDRLLSVNPNLTLENLKDPKYETLIARYLQPILTGSGSVISAQTF